MTLRKIVDREREGWLEEKGANRGRQPRACDGKNTSKLETDHDDRCEMEEDHVRRKMLRRGQGCLTLLYSARRARVTSAMRRAGAVLRPSLAAGLEISEPRATKICG
jgi:hypothetical protein